MKLKKKKKLVHESVVKLDLSPQIGKPLRLSLKSYRDLNL